MGLLNFFFRVQDLFLPRRPMGIVQDFQEYWGGRISVFRPWVGCLVCAAPTGLGMIFGDWISTNRSLLWGWWANCPFPKDQCHPSPALPINGIDGEGERGGGFNRVLNHFEPRRRGPFQAHATALRLWFPRPASGARGED